MNVRIHHSIRIRFGSERQVRLALEAKSHADAKAREDILRTVAADMLAAGRTGSEIEAVLRSLAEEQSIAALEALAEQLRTKLDRAPSAAVTFAELGDEWTSGRLLAKYPDYLRAKKSADDDAKRLGVLNKTVGKIPLSFFTLGDAERAMESFER